VPGNALSALDLDQTGGKIMTAEDIRADMPEPMQGLALWLRMKAAIALNVDDATALRDWSADVSAHAAQIAALEARVRELEAGQSPFGRTCATDGCERPSTVHFVRGGIGSHYCGDCYLKVQSVIGIKP
jgi:hypothetical protein